jgi:pyruvate/2-oxoacid:ferredoxin oxidoreductase beta subunit
LTNLAPACAWPLQSKASPLSSVVKFASGGKTRQKKELGLMMMQAYPDVYVASVCLEANYNQVCRGHARSYWTG